MFAIFEYCILMQAFRLSSGGHVTPGSDMVLGSDFSTAISHIVGSSDQFKYDTCLLTVPCSAQTC
jgi:hypothetical protein